MAPGSLAVEAANLLSSVCQDVCLREKEKQQLLTHVNRNANVYTDTLSQTDVLAHKIYATQDIPIKQKLYRVSFAKHKLMQEVIDEMLAANVIKPSSLMTSIPQKTGGYRFCVDYCKLNSITCTDAYPIPTVHGVPQ